VTSSSRTARRDDAVLVSAREGEAVPPEGPEPTEPSVPQSRRSRIFGRTARGERRPISTDSPLYLPAAALGVASVLLLGFCLQLVLIGDVSYARAQQLALAKFRYELARATAPVGQTFTPQPEIQGQAIAGEKAKAVEIPVPMLYPLGTPVAVMSIRALSMVDAVVLEGTTPWVTQRGPGHERNSVLPGQEGWCLLYGRAWSYGGPFGHINELRPGDEISVTTGQGKHTYAVTGVRRPGDPLPRRAAGQGRLVLGTAEGSAFVPENVVYVDAVLTSPVQPTPLRRALDLAPSEKIMAGDSSVWVYILLWVQGLTLAVLALSWARVRWGRAQAWLVGVPVLALMGLGTANIVVQLLPNVL
jgi:sortase A